ncbi:2-C-methyl-D-erythritol 2,4-cyclodiphosphate synthase [Chloroflexota bacterium]
MADKIRIGIGYDVHPLIPGRRLVLGGVEIPFDKGLEGWSDADALSHAIVDALLGAAALGDIGSHFPPGDPEYRGISSQELLRRVMERLTAAGWAIDNVDATVVAEQPKLGDFIDKMREQLSRTLGITVSQVSVKATTSNRLGFVGREEGIAAQAVVLIRELI